MAITIILFVVLYMIDQITKYYASLVKPDAMSIIPKLLTFEYYENRGMAWGMFDDNTPILVVISLIATIILFYFALKIDWKKKKLYSISITLMLAGCVGNLFDRAICLMPYLGDGRDGVIDMISFEPLNWVSNLFGQGNFPVFNFADACLVVGVIILMIWALFFAERDNKKKYAEIKNKRRQQQNKN